MQGDEGVDAPVSRHYLQIRHQPTGAIIAAGPLGWGITPFEGNYYIRRRYLCEGHFRPDFVPGVCVYKGLYVGLDYIAPDDTVSDHLGWTYWLPNPLFPFIMFRVAIPADHPLLIAESMNEHAACRYSQVTRVITPSRCWRLDSAPTDEETRHAP
jgi:uncharacterized protein (DUF427 family)